MYQIYDIRARYSEDATEKELEGLGGRWIEGLPPGRIWSGDSWTKMPREQTTLEEMEALVPAMWEEYQPHLMKKRGERNRSEPEFTVKFIREETWCQGWFSHWTWDTGQSDNEVLNSFEDFVLRMEVLNRREGHYDPNMGLWMDKYVLMGAEDRWRWKGRDGSDPPCRCAGCKEQGIIKIDH